MNFRAAAYNLSAHAVDWSAQQIATRIETLYRWRFELTGYQRGRSAQRPIQPAEARLRALATTPPADPPVMVHCCPYRLLDRPVLGHRPDVPLPEGWVPRAAAPLEDSLPFPWDPLYREDLKHPFQPVKLWRNALVLCDLIEQNPGSTRARSARSILRQLVLRMQEYTVEAEGAAWLENRFDYEDREVFIPRPWVSGIGNAFAILACLRMHRHLPTLDLAQRYARAYRTPYVQGQARPERWITARDARGYLWFEEYPTHKGRLLHIKNGHIFAVLALHEMSLLTPEAETRAALQAYVRAGASTIAAYAPCLRRPAQTSLYALNWHDKPDYLPARAVRQLYQLSHLTGSQAFLTQGDLFLQDMKDEIDTQTQVDLAATRRLLGDERART